MAMPELRRFFVPSVEPGPGLADTSTLDCNTDLALRLLRTQGRNCMIVWDETTYFPQYNILHLGDGNDSKPCYVGGADGKAVTDARGTRPEQLQKLDLAQVCLSFIVKRASAEITSNIFSPGAFGSIPL